MLETHHHGFRLATGPSILTFDRDRSFAEDRNRRLRFGIEAQTLMKDDSWLELQTSVGSGQI